MGSGERLSGAEMRPTTALHGIGDSWKIDSVPSWRRCGAVASPPGIVPAQNWETALRKSKAKLCSEIGARFKSLDKSLDASLAAGDKQVDHLHRQLSAEYWEATTEASQALEKAVELEEAINKQLNALEACVGIGCGAGGLVVATGATPMSLKMGCDVSTVEQERIFQVC